MEIAKILKPIKTLIAHHPQNPIAYFPHQTAIALHHPQKTLAYFPHQTAIAPSPKT